MALTPGQQQCVNTLDRPLVVAAGAGSGKTYTLTQRIVGALENGFLSDIDEVCAITFTTKAAAELKSRIKAELRTRGLVGQALRVDEAWVSTIHGMCARILRAHALELGIDPAFRVADGAEVAGYLAQAVDDVLVDAQAADSPRLDALFAEYPARSAGRYGTSVEGMLSAIVEAAAAQGEGSDDIVLPGVVMKPEAIVETAVEIAGEILAAAQAEKEGAKRDEWIAAADQALQDATGILAGGVSDHAAALRAIAPFKFAKTFGSKEYRARVDEARVRMGACVMEARLGAARPHLETLVGLARRVLDSFAALKRADGVLDNSDLLVMAARAIEEHPAIAAQYADKFKLVMVDEFQDTDQMQVDMIKRLAGAGASRLCTVGDAQQSIYRFRGADVSVYRRHLASVRASWPDSVIQLSDNFRSHADVLAFVDCVFGRPSMFGGEFMSLAAGRDEAKVKAPFSDEQPRVVVQHTSRPRVGIDSGAAVRVAAARIADEFARLVEAGHAPSEMVVLLGRMFNAGVYAQALRDRGLACVVAGGSVFARSMEAQVMGDLVRVIANPFETQSLFSVLTGPLFALSAGDILQVGGMDGFWRAAFDGQRDESADSARLSNALRVMASLRESAGRVPVARLMERAAVDAGWLSRLQAQGPEGLASAGNVFKAIRIVRGIEESGAYGPATVSQRFAEELTRSKEAPGALSVSGGDSVRIMTIHASKGLEFPIVAVAEMKESHPPSSRLLLSSVAGKVYASLDLGSTLDEVGNALDASTMTALGDYVLGLCAGEDELAAAVADDAGALHRRLAQRGFEAAGDGEEAKRLLYVALTRAKEALVVSTIGVRTKDNPLGLPKTAMLGVFEALDPAGSAIGEGRSACAYGGSAPAAVECIALQADAGSEPATSCQASGGGFAVPAFEERQRVEWEPCALLHEDVFSYSSISDASHEGDVLDALAGAYAVAVDVAASGGDWPDELASSRRAALPTSSFEDDFWDFDVSQAFDEDRATDLGTAFHRLAQHAVVARGGQGPLVMPPAERVAALARTCNLDQEQRQRLEEALVRWFGCTLAADMVTLADLASEVPFFVAVPSEAGGSAYLEGEIDLLGFDGAREHATVVDYKTGGRADESPDDLRRKHVLQAACYAYAIMLQGVQSVDAVFVRVERPRADALGEPQCVRYRFTAEDIPLLARAIAGVYARA